MNDTDRNRSDDERLIAQAKAYAAVLRREAIDDFWRGLGSVLRRALQGAARRRHRLGAAGTGAKRV